MEIAHEEHEWKGMGQVQAFLPLVVSAKLLIDVTEESQVSCYRVRQMSCEVSPIPW